MNDPYSTNCWSDSPKRVEDWPVPSCLCPRPSAQWLQPRSPANLIQHQSSAIATDSAPGLVLAINRMTGPSPSCSRINSLQQFLSTFTFSSENLFSWLLALSAMAPTMFVNTWDKNNNVEITIVGDEDFYLFSLLVPLMSFANDYDRVPKVGGTNQPCCMFVILEGFNTVLTQNLEEARWEDVTAHLNLSKVELEVIKPLRIVLNQVPVINSTIVFRIS